MILEHNIATDYTVQEYPNGVIVLMIRCKNKEFQFNDWNDYMFDIYNEDITEVLTIPDFLDDSKYYNRACRKDKDLIIAYYIPVDPFWSRNKLIKTIVV